MSEFEMEFVSEEIGNIEEEDRVYLNMHDASHGVVVIQTWNVVSDCYVTLQVWQVPKGSQLPHGGIMQQGELLYLRGKTAQDFLNNDRNTETWGLLCRLS